jgi:quercetin dioxygenase-like cupin family protein
VSVDVSKKTTDVTEFNNNSSNEFYQKYKIDEIVYTIILNGKYNHGKYSIIEMDFPLEKEKEISLHKHTKEDIVICVIEGKFSIQYKNEIITATPGMVLKLEKNTAHSYKKIGKKYGKLLMLFTPAGFENYFRDLTSYSLKRNIKFLNADDDRIRLHLLEKNYGWIFSG